MSTIVSRSDDLGTGPGVPQAISLEVKNLRIWDPERGFIVFDDPLRSLQVPLQADQLTLPFGDYQLQLTIEAVPDKDSAWYLHCGSTRFILTPGVLRAFYIDTAQVSRQDGSASLLPLRAVFDLIGG